MEPIEFLKIARRRWWIIAGSVLLLVLLAWLTAPAAPARGVARPAPTQPTSFEATHTLVGRSTSPLGESSARSGGQNLEVLALYIKSGEVPNRVAWKLLSKADPAVLVAQVETKVDPKAGTISITANDSNGERAANLVNTFAAELLSYLSEQQTEAHQRAVEDALVKADAMRVQAQDLEARLSPQPPPGDPVLRAQRDALVRQYSAAFERYQQLNGQGPPPPPLMTAQRATPVAILPEQKQPARVSVPSDRGGRTMVAGLLGLFVGFGLAVGVDRLDTRLRTREQFEEVLHLPVLAEVPQLPRRQRRAPKLPTGPQPGSAEAEAFRMLRATLLLVARPDGSRQHLHRGPQVFLVTSPASGDGRTTVAANLAASFAEAGRTALALDCDFWRPRLHEMVGVPDEIGVLDTLADASAGAARLADVVRPTPVPRLAVATAGRQLEHAAELLGRASDLINQARQLADVVIIDTGPILASSNVTELLPAVDAVVVVARVGRTSPGAAQRTMDTLTRLHAPALGLVLLGVERPLWRGRHHIPARPPGDSLLAAQRLDPTDPTHHGDGPTPDPEERPSVPLAEVDQPAAPVPDLKRDDPLTTLLDALKSPEPALPLVAHERVEPVRVDAEERAPRELLR